MTNVGESIEIQNIPGVRGTYKHSEISKLFQRVKGKLRRGDITLAAAIAGCSENTLERMLKDPADPHYRNPATSTGLKALMALDTVFLQRKALTDIYHSRMRRLA